MDCLNFRSTLSWFDSFLILSSTTACSVVITAFNTLPVSSFPMAGNGCLDKKSKGSTSSLPGSYFISKSTSCLSITDFSMRGGSFADGLLNIGNNGLCAVTIVNLGAHWEVHTKPIVCPFHTQRSLFCLTVPFFSSTVSDRLLKCTGCKLGYWL